MSDKKYICPKCKSNEVIDILYGYPSPEALQSWFKKEVEFGGVLWEKRTLTINVKNVNINGKDSNKF
jgi:hypothetical protein